MGSFIYFVAGYVTAAVVALAIAAMAYTLDKH